MTLSFSKTLVFKCFLSTLIRKAVVFKFLQIEERFLKVPFQISVDGGPNRRIKATFSNSSGLKSVFEKLR